MRVLGYARVSSAEQALGTSLQDQQDAITTYAKSRGLTVTRFYVEAASGIRKKAEHREQMMALMRDVRKGDLVLCDKLDRWSRDAEFSYKSIREILEKGASFYAVGDACDPSTPEGDSALGFRILFAREEHKRIRSRLLGTRTQLQDKGYYASGLPPYGYRRKYPRGYKGLDRIDKNILQIEPEQAARVRETFDRYVSGASMLTVAKAMGMHLSDVKKLLSRRTYLGEVRSSRGEWIKGRHEAIVDPETFAAAQAMMSRKRRRGASEGAETDTWILRDVAVCAHCSAKMGAAYAGTPDARRYYYRCTAMCRARGAQVTTGSYVSVPIVESAFEEMFLRHLGSLRSGLAGTPERRKATDTTTARVLLQRRRDRLLRQHEMGAIGDGELRSGLERLDIEKMRLDAVDAPAPAMEPAYRKEALRSLDTITYGWAVATPQQKRAIVNRLTWAVAMAAKAPPIPEWRTVDEITRKRS